MTESAWNDATRKMIESTLQCPKCNAINREHASPLVTLGPGLVADCAVCAHHFVVLLLREQE